MALVNIEYTGSFLHRRIQTFYEVLATNLGGDGAGALVTEADVDAWILELQAIKADFKQMDKLSKPPPKPNRSRSHDKETAEW